MTLSPLALRRLLAAAALATAVVVGAAACGNDTESGGTTTEAPAPAEDAGEPVERFNNPTDPVIVPAGQTFQITLPADPEACFAWSLTPPDSDVLTLVTSRPSAVAAPDQDRPLTAEANTDIFEFTADTSGRVDLSFAEVSPCEPGTTRATRTVPVVVTGS
jgi:predicted secreted protein